MKTLPKKLFLFLWWWNWPPLFQHWWGSWLHLWIEWMPCIHRNSNPNNCCLREVFLIVWNWFKKLKIVTCTVDIIKTYCQAWCVIDIKVHGLNKPVRNTNFKVLYCLNLIVKTIVHYRNNQALYCLISCVYYLGLISQCRGMPLGNNLIERNVGITTINCNSSGYLGIMPLLHPW